MPPIPPPEPPKPRPKQLTYREALDGIVADLSKGSIVRRSEIEKYIDATQPPQELIKALQREKDLVESKPTSVWGIQTPRLLQVQYAGQDFRIPFGFLSAALAIALGPLIIGWLGALYMTRQRELINIAHIEDYKLAFPHLLNFLPVNFYTFAQPTESSQMQKIRTLTSAFNRVSQGIFRSAVILLFSVPMVFGFMYSLTQLWEIEPDDFSSLFFLGVGLVLVMVIQSLVLLLQEWLFMRKKEFYE